MPSMPTSEHLPAITCAQLALHHTRFSNWFPLYRRHSPKAIVIDLLELQPDFVDWLQEDGIVLPRHSDDEQYIDSDKSDDELSDDGEEEAEGRNFDPLNERIRQILSLYEGAVFPKLDWSAPLDAAWIIPGSTLRCTTPSDVYLLLKSSDFVCKDVKQLRELEMMEQSSLARSSDGQLSTIRPVLVLKKYFTIPTSHEFRCFVRAGRLICISQRDTGTYFDHLQEHSMQLQIRKLLQNFYNDVLLSIQHDRSATTETLRHTPFPINDFVWDAYVSRDLKKVFLIDVNPFLERTDALLWTWSEVEEIAERWSMDEAASDDDIDGDDDEDDTIMRIFTDGREPILIRANGRAETSLPRPPRTYLPHLRTITSRAQATQSFPTYTRNMVPSEVVGAAEGNSIAEFAREWNRKIAQSVVEEEVDGDEEVVITLPGR